MVKNCKDCTKFKPFPIPHHFQEDSHIYGQCSKGKRLFREQTEPCFFVKYYRRRIREAVLKAGRILKYKIRRWLCWTIYYKIEKLWIRPKLCTVCGENMGKYYFGAHKFPIEGTGNYVPIPQMAHTVHWTGKYRKIAHWECNTCFTQLNNGTIFTPDITVDKIGIAGIKL